jgi:hypothetical protein
LQEAGQLGTGQSAEKWDEDADRPIARRLDVLDFHSQGVARLGTLDIYRAGLRVEVGAENLRGPVIRSGDLALEGVIGVDRYRLTRLDGGDRVHVAAEDVVIRTLLSNLPHGSLLTGVMG